MRSTNESLSLRRIAASVSRANFFGSVSPIMSSRLSGVSSEIFIGAARDTYSIAQLVAGIIVKQPMTYGNKIRLTRCFARDKTPRLRHSIAVKKPLSRKNSGMRKPCIALNTKYNEAFCSLSCTGHGKGIKDNDACKTMPSNIAKLRSASRW